MLVLRHEDLCFAIFDSYLSSALFVWAPNYSTIQQILILQKRLCELIISNQGIPAPFQNFNIKLAWKIFCLSANLSIIYHYQF